VLMPVDYIQRLPRPLAPRHRHRLRAPIGSRPDSFGAEIECAFLNTYQARWQYAGESCGYGFAQGKTMLWRRETLEAGGSIELWERKSRKMRRPPSSSGRKGSAPISSIGPSSSRSAGEICATYGRGSFAGRG